MRGSAASSEHLSILKNVIGKLRAIPRALKRNSILEQFQKNRGEKIVKRRSLAGKAIAQLANCFFCMAKLPIRFYSDVRAWQRWEVKCFRMLNGRSSAHPAGDRAVC